MKLLMQNLKTHLVERELGFNSQLWGEWPLRTQYEGSPHRDATDIWLRFRDPFEMATLTPVEFCNSRYTPQWYACMDKLRHTQKIIEKIFLLMDGEELGACLITKVPPGKGVAWHSDDNWNSNHFLNKYLVVIQTGEGAYFETCGEKHPGKAGDLFLFDNRLPHRVVNDSDVDRISLIISIKQKGQEVKA